MKKIISLIVILALVSFFGCGNKNSVVTLDSGLMFKDDSLGTGREVQRDDMITVHYKIWIVKDSTSLFSDWTKDVMKNIYMIADTKARNQPVKFVLTKNSFIKGSYEGLLGMQTGGRRTIIVPSELAYGKEGMREIPPDTDIKIAVELLDVKDKIVAAMWNVDTSLYKTTESGLTYAIIKEGDGATADSGDVVTVNYTGYLVNGTKFDSSVERDESFSFLLGIGQIMPGWDEGIMLMRKGSKARFVIPPGLAYGELDLKNIPANSTLIFDIELLDIQ